MVIVSDMCTVSSTSSSSVEVCMFGNFTTLMFIVWNVDIVGS